MFQKYTIAKILTTQLLYLASAAAATAAFAYSPNPRAIHPNGRLPTTTQARRKLPYVREALEKDRYDPPILLIDGNNIRNSFGFQDVSALDLTEKLSRWSIMNMSILGQDQQHYTYDENLDTTTTNGNTNVDHGTTTLPSSLIADVICVWDGGSKVTSLRANSTLAILSGQDGNADDILVQCCAFLCSKQTQQNIIIFTSDANLANRCKMQLMEESSSSSSLPSPKTKVSHIYHSIYLCLLLDEHDEESTDFEQRQQELNPDWERQERRTSVNELQLELQLWNDKNDANPHQDAIVTRTCTCSSISKWIDDGMPGLRTGRVTKGGSILYQIE